MARLVWYMSLRQSPTSILITSCDPHPPKTQIEGRDKRGHSCLVLRPRFHVPGQFPFEDMMRYTVWVLETVTSASKSADGYISAIWDCQGQGYKNMDPSLVTAQDGIITTMKVCACVGAWVNVQVLVGGGERGGLCALTRGMLN
jgi:hypothetical protein